MNSVNSKSIFSISLLRDNLLANAREGINHFWAVFLSGRFKKVIVSIDKALNGLYQRCRIIT